MASTSVLRENNTQKVAGIWFNQIICFLRRTPVRRKQVFKALERFQRRGLLEEDAVRMMQSVMQVFKLQVGEVMIARGQMVTLDSSHSMDEILPVVVDSAHSRFPVIDGDRDRVIGILLAKDLLRYRDQPNRSSSDWTQLARPSVFVPESKRLNVLLQEFRNTRNHIAIVVDEYGGVVGLVTIEDVLEEIVGDIEDETDIDEESTMILRKDNNLWVIRAELTISSFNNLFGTQLSDRIVDTIGGIVTNKLGHVPRRGEKVIVEGHEVEVISADASRSRLLRVNFKPTD